MPAKSIRALARRRDQEDAHHHHVAKPETVQGELGLDLAQDRAGLGRGVAVALRPSPAGAVASTGSGTVPLT